MKKHTFMSFVIDEETSSADLYIYGDIVSADWEKYSSTDVTADDIKKQLKETNAKTINVHINSFGGDTFTAIAIYNMLREKSKSSQIVVTVDAIAASAASIIAMAGDQIIMPKNTLMMIHNCWTITLGNANELRKTADDMDKIMESVMNCYLSKVNISKDELKELLDNETYLTADEALEKGFCDTIIDLKDDNSSALSSLVKIIKQSKNDKNENKQNLNVNNQKVQENEKEKENQSDGKTSLFNLN